MYFSNECVGFDRMLLFSVIAVVCGLSTVSGQRVLALPDPKSCSKRVKHAVWTDPLGTTHNYFFSWLHKPTAELEVDWLDARNICRRHCMDAVSLETLQENEFVKQQMARCKIFFANTCFSSQSPHNWYMNYARHHPPFSASISNQFQTNQSDLIEEKH